MQQQIDIRLYNAQVDYTQPSADGKGTLETGLKLQTQRMSGSLATRRPTATSPSGELPLDPASSFDYRFTQAMPAAYVNYQRTLATGWSAQGGLRTEATILNGDVPARSVAIQQNYLTLFPSVTGAHELGRESGQSRLQLSYIRRLNRPDFMQQLPLQSYQDPRSYRRGNPTLLPEFSHNPELGHQLNLAGGASLTTTVFARFTEQAIQRVRSVDTLATRRSNVGVVTQETYFNNGTTSTLGVELNAGAHRVVACVSQWLVVPQPGTSKPAGPAKSWKAPQAVEASVARGNWGVPVRQRCTATTMPPLSRFGAASRPNCSTAEVFLSWPQAGD